VSRTEVIWTPDKKLSPAERALLLRILFGPQAAHHFRKAQTTNGLSRSGTTLGVETNAPAAAGTAPGLAD
jgi:hypothetical protein